MTDPVTEGAPVRPDPADARWRRVVDHVTDGLAVADLDGRFVDANAAYLATVGRTLDDLRGLDVRSITHPDDRARNGPLLERLLAGDSDDVSIEQRYLRPDGTPVWVHVRVTLLRDDAGRPEGFVATSQDVSQERRTEASLRHSPSLLRMAGAMARVGGWAVDLPGGQLHWSDEVFALLRRPTDDPPELDDVMDRFEDEDRQRIAAAMDVCRTDGVPWDLEARIRDYTGELRWVRSVCEATRAPDGTITGLVGAVQDITVQKAAMEAAGAAAERLTTTLESITDAFCTLDRDWRFVYVNGRAEQLLQRTREELVGRVLWEEFPASRDSVLHETYLRAFATQRTEVLEAYYYPPLDVWLEINAYPSPQGLAVYFRDVSDRLERERSLHRVLAAEQQAIERLRHVDDVKTAFLSAVSHELRTPLTVVHGLAATLRRVGDTVAPARRVRIEEALLDHSDRLRRLLDDLLDVDRLTRGTLVSSRSRADAAEVLGDAVRRSRIADRIVVDGPERLDMEVDRIQFDRIVENLLDNAAKYAPSGQVAVRLQPTEHGGLRLRVQDEGPGIPASGLQQVFLPFERLDRDHPQPGTGIGLALVAAFARLHGGRAWAEDTGGRGAHLVVELGAATTPGRGADASDARRGAPGHAPPR